MPQLQWQDSHYTTVLQGRRHGFLSGGDESSAVWPTYFQNTLKIGKGAGFDHFILESGGRPLLTFPLLGTRPPPPPPASDAHAVLQLAQGSARPCRMRAIYWVIFRSPRLSRIASPPICLSLFSLHFSVSFISLAIVVQPTTSA